jgi:ABC-type uncharacterized transport system involved in gliding motility auxiliary subunit
MIASYGVSVRPELALDRNALTLQYQTRMPNSNAIISRIVRYPFWIGVTAENGNSAHPVSALFDGLDLFWPSPLELHPPLQVEAAPLFTSTPQAWLMRGEFVTNPEMAYQFDKDAAETAGRKIFGASLTGEFPSFFEGAPKPQRYGSEEELPDMPLRANASRIIVVGDTDFATNIINATNASQNLDFLIRAADWLVSDDDVITIRNRQPHTGRLDKILDKEKRTAAMSFAQALNVGLIPLLVIAAGLFLSYRRRIRSKEVSNGV